MSCSVSFSHGLNHQWPLRAALGLTVALLGLTGCGNDRPERHTAPDGRALGKVIGWVTLDGKPLSGAQVDFHNKTTRTCSAGTDENGFYELKFNRKLAGAPVGEHTVSIGLFGNNAEDPADEPLPAIYNKDTILKTTIQEGRNVVNFHLTTPGGGRDFVETGRVTGRVILNGSPLVGANITFRADDNKIATGVTDDQGRYALTYTEQRPGAVVGPNRVMISRLDENGQETIRDAYNTESTLIRFVEAGDSEANFSLTSKLKSTKPSRAKVDPGDTKTGNGRSE